MSNELTEQEKEYLLNTVEQITFKVTKHFSETSTPMFIPREMFDTLSPLLPGVYLLNEDVKAAEGTDLPEMYVIEGYIPV